MSAKGNPYRFTLQFNEKDHRQRFVADLLNDGMGRQKAQYITDAILHYINCVQNPDIEQDKDERLRQKIELMVQQAWDKMSASHTSAPVPPPERPKLRKRKAEVITDVGSGPDIDEKELGAILEALDQFTQA